MSTDFAPMRQRLSTSKAPKRSSSAYSLFYSLQNKPEKSTRKEKSFLQLAGAIAQKWNSMEGSDRERFYNQSMEERDNFRWAKQGLQTKRNNEKLRELKTLKREKTEILPEDNFDEPCPKFSSSMDKNKLLDEVEAQVFRQLVDVTKQSLEAIKDPRLSRHPTESSRIAQAFRASSSSSNLMALQASPTIQQHACPDTRSAQVLPVTDSEDSSVEEPKPVTQDSSDADVEMKETVGSAIFLDALRQGRDLLEPLAEDVMESLF